MGKESFDYVIVGAGLIGSSVAMHLSERLQGQGKSVALLDADFAGKLSSSELNAGGARATWNQPINIRLAQDSLDFFREHQQDVGFHENGYLWLFDDAAWAGAQARAKRLNEFNLNVEVLSVAGLQARAPFIDKTDGIAGATFSPRDGLFNPNLLKGIFRQRAEKAGTKFLDGYHVRGVVSESGKFLIQTEWSRPDDDEQLEALLVRDQALRQLEKRTVEAKVVVNCAGAWAGQLAKMLGYESPTWPVRRQACVFTCREVDMSKNGMIVDTSGVYFHPEANNILAGWADPSEPRGKNLNYDGLSFFEERIWMPLYERSSKFESLKHITGWAGLYEMSPDHSGIVGAVGQRKDIFEAHGFSGHGAMQSFAVGRALAEKIHLGHYETIDCNELSGGRFAEGRRVEEGLLI